MIKESFCAKIEEFINYYRQETGALPSVERIAKLFGTPVQTIRKYLEHMGREDIPSDAR